MAGDWTAVLLLLLLLVVALVAAHIYLTVRLYRRIRSHFKSLRNFVWDTVNVVNAADGNLPLPRSGGWSASPDVLVELITATTERRPSVILEFGSGLSTLMIASALAKVGGGRVVSIDHDAEFAARTRRQLEARGLAAFGEVRVAPITDQQIDGELRPWYDVAAIGEVEGIGIAFVDGPPAAIRPDVRYPALSWLWPRLEKGAVVFLDDAGRHAEREIAQRWARHFPEAKFVSSSAEKGILRIYKPD